MYERHLWHTVHTFDSSTPTIASVQGVGTCRLVVHGVGTRYALLSSRKPVSSAARFWKSLKVQSHVPLQFPGRRTTLKRSRHRQLALSNNEDGR